MLFFGNLPARIIGERDARGSDHRDLFVAQKNDVSRVAQHGGNVGRDEELTVTKTHDDRRPVSDGHDLVRIVGRDEHEREETAQVEQRTPHRVLQTVALHLALDQVRDDLGVRLGDERVSFFCSWCFRSR